MKVVDRALEVLPPCPARVAAAATTALDAIAEQGQGFAADVGTCADALATDFPAVAAKMQEIPGLLDPQAILDCCTGVLEQAAADLRRLADDAAAIPQRLLEQAAGTQQLVASVHGAVGAMATLLPQLAELAPDLGGQLAFFESLPARGQALADLAVQGGALVERHGRELWPLAQALQGVAALEGGAAGGLAQALVAKAQQVQASSLAQVGALRAQLGADVDDLEQAVAAAIALATATIDGVAGLLATRSEALLQPLRDQAAAVRDAGAALARETGACANLFDAGDAQLGRIGDVLLQPLALARAQVDAVVGKIEEAGAQVDALARKALVPVDALDARFDALAAALGAVIQAIEDEVAQLVQLMRELDAEAEQVKPVLRALPGHFDLVRTAIGAAIALLEQVKGNIPGFVGEANGALRNADGELDQADALCIHAIEICTLYQMKAPALMLARTLFVGIKATIPALHATIAGAVTAVQAAGTQATALMDTAIGTVDALNPLLDQAIALVQQAIDALLVLLRQMQDGLLQVMAAAEAVAPPMRSAVETALAAAREALATVRQAADDCLAQLQCEALVARLRAALSNLLDSTFTPLQAQIDAATGPLRGVLQQGKAGVGQASAAAQGGLEALAGALDAAQEQARTPVQSLQEVLAAARARIETTGAAARATGRQAADQALACVDRAAQAIEGIDVRRMAGPVLAHAAYVDGFAADFQSARAQVADAGALDATLAGWRAQAQQQAAGLLDQVTATAAQAAQSVAGVQSAGQEAAAGAQAQRATLADDGTVGARVQATFDSMRADAQGVADGADAALADMSAALDDARAQSETVGQVDPATGEAELADLRAQAEAAAASAEQAQRAEKDVGGGIAAAQEQVAAAAQQAEARATALKDQAQAEICKAQAQAGTARAGVNAARADAIKAEAIVDAEVVKHGGASSKEDAEADGAADAAPQEAAAATGATAAAGAVAGAGAGADSASADGAGATAGGASGEGAAPATGSAAPANGAGTPSADSKAGDSEAADTTAADTTAASADSTASASDGAPSSADAGAQAGEAAGTDTTPDGAAPPAAATQEGAGTPDTAVASPATDAGTDTIAASASAGAGDEAPVPAAAADESTDLPDTPGTDPAAAGIDAGALAAATGKAGLAGTTDALDAIAAASALPPDLPADLPTAGLESLAQAVGDAAHKAGQPGFKLPADPRDLAAAVADRLAPDPAEGETDAPDEEAPAAGQHGKRARPSSRLSSLLDDLKDAAASAKPPAE